MSYYSPHANRIAPCGVNVIILKYNFRKIVYCNTLYNNLYDICHHYTLCMYLYFFNKVITSDYFISFRFKANCKLEMVSFYERLTLNLDKRIPYITSYKIVWCFTGQIFVIFITPKTKRALP